MKPTDYDKYFDIAVRVIYRVVLWWAATIIIIDKIFETFIN